MKKKILIFISMLAILLLVACSSEEEPETVQGNEDGVLTVFTTIYPLQYFTERIGGDTVTIKNIVPPGSDAHSVEINLRTMEEVAESDAFIHTGTGLESFADSVADSLKNENVSIVNASENIEFIGSVDIHNEEEEEPMEESTDSDDEHSESDIDPHIWLDPERAIILAENIKNSLVELDPDNRDNFENNFAVLKTELEELDTEFQKVVTESKTKTFVVSHSAYGYWEDAYGLTQIGINGMSPTSEPSQNQLTEIVEMVKDNNLQYIFFEPNLSNKVAEIIKNETNTETLTLNNLESITDENIKNNEDYFDVMRKNIQGLEQALN